MTLNLSFAGGMTLNSLHDVDRWQKTRKAISIVQPRVFPNTVSFVWHPAMRVVVVFHLAREGEGGVFSGV